MLDGPDPKARYWEKVPEKAGLLPGPSPPGSIPATSRELLGLQSSLSKHWVVIFPLISFFFFNY